MISPFSIIILFDLLSAYIVIGDLWLNNSYIMLLNHRDFLMHSEALMYSSSALEIATIVCFLEYHEIGEFPVKNIYLMLISGLSCPQRNRHRCIHGMNLNHYIKFCSI